MKNPKQITRNLLFHFALGLVISGTGFLVWTTGHSGSVLILVALGIVWLGMASSYHLSHAARLKKLLFPVLIIVLVALVQFFASILSWPVNDYWPAYVISVGIGLFISGLYIFRQIKAAWLVPALSFILLGCLFLVFSLGFSSMSFRAFIRKWWPTLLLAGGVILFAIYFFMKAFAYLNEKNRRSDESEQV